MSKAKAVAASRKKAGIKPTSVLLTDEQKKQWDEFAAELGLSRVDALIEAIESYKGQGAISKARLIAEIERRLK